MSAIPWVGHFFLTSNTLFYNICLNIYNIKIKINKLLTKVTHILSKKPGRSLIISSMPSIRNYSTTNNVSLNKLHPDFVSGFIDAEGSFSTAVYYKNRWCVNSVFKISLHLKDKELLNSIQAFFGVGRVTGSVSADYRVERISDLVEVIIPHLDKYPLISKKKADYELFKRIVFMMNDRLHLTDKGLQEIINIKATMNKGLSEELYAEFPDTLPVVRPVVKEPVATDIRPNWIAGFTSGDGCFYIYVENNIKFRSGYRIKLRFNIVQHFRDKSLLECVSFYFNCGNILETSRGEVSFDVTKFSDNYEKISNFFSKYPIHGIKALDFNDWKLAAEIVKSKDHLTKQGVEKIIKIKSNMNKSRGSSY